MTQAGVGYRNFVERFEQAYREELAVFLEIVRSGGESPCSLEDARAALSVALAADRSRKERRPMRVEDLGLARTAPDS
jgi:myo-inositol 2-dehydrogenase/D-chiro-inositol 1-dehydrogenase